DDWSSLTIFSDLFHEIYRKFQNDSQLTTLSSVYDCYECDLRHFRTESGLSCFIQHPSKKNTKQEKEKWIRKAILEQEKGNTSVLLLPVDSIQRLLIGIGSLAEVNPFEGKMGYCIIHGLKHDAETIAAQRVVYEALMLSRGVVLPIFQPINTIFATSFADGPDGQVLTSDLNAGSFTGQRGSTTGVDDNDPDWVLEGASFDDGDQFENVGNASVDDFAFIHTTGTFTIYLGFFIDSDSTGFDTLFDTRGDGTEIGVTAFWRRDTGVFTLIVGYASGFTYEVSSFFYIFNCFAIISDLNTIRYVIHINRRGIYAFLVIHPRNNLRYPFVIMLLCFINNILSQLVQMFLCIPFTWNDSTFKKKSGLSPVWILIFIHLIF
ncbi:hypothetical protein LCGC14_1923920, partial [marine sediment metagenome]